MTTAVIIMCAGEGKRWGKDYPKHIALINGKPNVKRTHDMVVKNGFKPKDIYITVSNENGEHFPTELNLIVGDSSREIDRFRNGFSILKDYDRTIFLYGDTIYHIDDLEKILLGDGYSFYGKKLPNRLTGKPYGELYGIVVTKKDEFIQNVNQVASDFDNGIIFRETGWEVYNSPYSKEIKTFTELSSLTDDYDYYDEYINLIEIFFPKTRPPL
jgi:NDP-sugar pyrophosphorylase family protein